MLNELIKKTASAPNTVTVRPGPIPGTEPGAGALRINFAGIGTFWRFIQLLIFIALGSAALASILHKQDTVRVGSSAFEVQVADSAEERTQGLSGASSLAIDEGMLFIFSEDDYWPIWMKDMNFAIDIVWLDSNKEVINIDSNVSPGSYPKSLYLPEKPARYVLELRAGTAEAVGIKAGQGASFNISQ